MIAYTLGGEDCPRQLNQLQNAAAGHDSPSPSRSSYAASTGKAENSWNSAPCSTKVLEERCWRSANPYGAGRGYRWKCLLHPFKKMLSFDKRYVCCGRA